jgi:hypothetical protein
VAGIRVLDAAETTVCARLDAINQSVVPAQRREVVKPHRSERDPEYVFILLFD